MNCRIPKRICLKTNSNDNDNNSSRAECLDKNMDELQCLIRKTLLPNRWQNNTSKRESLKRSAYSSGEKVDECCERYKLHKRVKALLSKGRLLRETALNAYSHEPLSEEHRALLWLELNAWRNGQSITEYDAALFKSRQQAAEVLMALRTFKFEDVVPSKASNVFHPINLRDHVQQLDFLAECSCGDFFASICKPCAERETRALIAVDALLHQVDRLESLYPSWRVLVSEHSEFAGEDVQIRLRTLNAWRNLMVDERKRIVLMSRLFRIGDWQEAGWPHGYWTTLLPTDGAIEDGLSNGDRLCTSICGVPFTPNADYSPPILTAPQSASSSLSDMDFESSPLLSLPTHKTNEAPVPAKKEVLLTGSELSAAYFAKYIDKVLKDKGVTEIFVHMKSTSAPTLYKLHAYLKPTGDAIAYAADCNPVSVILNEIESNAGTNSLTSERRDSLLSHARDTFQPFTQKEYLRELTRYGVHSKCYQEMKLPSLHRLYFFHLHVILQLGHELVRLRLSRQPVEPSLLSISQLFLETRETMRMGVLIRQRISNLTRVVIGSSTISAKILRRLLEGFDLDLRRVLQLYLKYLATGMAMFRETNTVVAQKKNFLEHEWQFARSTSPYIPGGEALTARTFCQLASEVLNVVQTKITVKMKAAVEDFRSALSSSDEPMSLTDNRRAVQHWCRQLKTLSTNAIDYLRQALSFTRTLKNDLDIAAEFRPLVPHERVFDKLLSTGHVRIILPCDVSHFLFVPGHIKEDAQHIWELIATTFGHDERGNSCENNELSNGRDGYLVIYGCHLSVSDDVTEPNQVPIWHGDTIGLEPSADSLIAFSVSVKCSEMYLITLRASELHRSRDHFNEIMTDVVEIAVEQTSPNPEIGRAFYQLKIDTFGLRNSITESIEEAQKCFEWAMSTDALNREESVDKGMLHSRCVDAIQHLFKVGFEIALQFDNILCQLISPRLSLLYVCVMKSYAVAWIEFVLRHCELGQGVQNRWASQGMDYLALVSEPRFMKNLTLEDFKEFESMIQKCIAHLTRERNSSPSSLLPKPFSRTHSLSSQFHRLWSNGSLTSPVSSDSGNCSPSILTNGHDHSIESSFAYTPAEQFSRAALELDRKMDLELRALRRIGTVVSDTRASTSSQILADTLMSQYGGPRKVHFTWQRGFKIGEGRSGKVYTAVNNNTGELICVKEIRLQPNDHRAICDLMDELKIFEGIRHENLVKYYGIELHREVLLMFMEYCNEGTLEVAAQMGLPEESIRRYTRELLRAVHVLHEHGIVHRDVKPANIFLTSDGGLKLGDFGCSIKLNNNTTMPGEAIAFVGTPAYMAPEVFTRREGYGRAADIWSLGCCVLEMLQRKRPWFELELHYQIMFRVGMGERPTMPDNISDELVISSYNVFNTIPDNALQHHNYSIIHFVGSLKKFCEPFYRLTQLLTYICTLFNE